MSVRSAANNILGKEFLKFGLVGISGIAVDFFITWLFKEKFKCNKYAANCAGFSFAVINNFLLNRYWTFNETIEPFGEQFLKFATFSLIGLVINTLLLMLLVKHLKFNFYIIKLMVISLVFLWNFSVNYLYTFH
jgi:putative flippase GtrA